MSESLINSIVTVLLAIVGVAIIAVLVSRQSNTAGVLSAGGGAFSNILGEALRPVSGGSRIGGISFTGGGAGIGIGF